MFIRVHLTRLSKPFLSEICKPTNNNGRGASFNLTGNSVAGLQGQKKICSISQYVSLNENNNDNNNNNNNQTMATGKQTTKCVYGFTAFH